MTDNQSTNVADPIWAAVGKVLEITNSDKYSKILLQREVTRGNRKVEDKIEFSCFADSVIRNNILVGDQIQAECYLTGREIERYGKFYRSLNAFAGRLKKL